MSLIGPLARGAALCALLLGLRVQAEASDIGLPPVPSHLPAGAAPQAQSGASGNIEIDVLVLYTPLAAQRLGGADALADAVGHWNDAANTYFVNSRMAIRYRLVGVREYLGTDENAGDLPVNQAAMAADPVLKSLRDELGADLVALVRAERVANCGLGGVFNGGEQSDPPANVNAERDAFEVLVLAPAADGSRCPDPEHTYAHELGHAIGGGHQAIPGATVGIYWKPYAHAWTCGIAPRTDLSGPAPTWFTIMYGGTGSSADTIPVNVTADGPGTVLPGPALGRPKTDFYSSPDFSLDGIACGINQPGGGEETQADNRRSMLEAAPYVAAYRGSKAAPLAQGAMTGGGALDETVLFGLLLGIARRLSFARRRAPWYRGSGCRENVPAPSTG